MDPILIMILVVVVIIAIAVLAWYYSHDQVVKRKLRSLPQTPIPQCGEGEQVKIIGKLEYFKERLNSPLSGRECAYYKIVVQEQRSSGKRTSWRTIINEEYAVDFLLDDGSGLALVKTGSHMKATLDEDANYRSGTFNDADEQLENYLKRHQTKSTGIFGWNKTLRYNEGILELGEKVAVIGQANWAKADSPDLQTNQDRILVLVGSQENPLYISDKKSVTQG